MRIAIFTYVPASSNRGNRITAHRWQTLLEELGHTVVAINNATIDQIPEFTNEPFDCLFAIHATRSFKIVEQFGKSFPGKPVVVCLSGTDLNCDLARLSYNLTPAPDDSRFQTAINTLELATAIVLLSPNQHLLLPNQFQDKCHTIIQSAKPCVSPVRDPSDQFLVTVIGHLRPVKDPFRTAMAVRDLPPASKIQVVHIGNAMDESMRTSALEETESNDRYQWIGELDHKEALGWLKSSRLTVLSSLQEGGPSLVSEAVVNEVPMICSRIGSLTGLMGQDYEGFFDVQDTNALTDLLMKSENDPEFLERLGQQLSKLRHRFTPQAELKALERLLDSLTVQ